MQSKSQLPKVSARARFVRVSARACLTRVSAQARFFSENESLGSASKAQHQKLSIIYITNIHLDCYYNSVFSMGNMESVLFQHV